MQKVYAKDDPRISAPPLLAVFSIEISVKLSAAQIRRLSIWKKRKLRIKLRCFGSDHARHTFAPLSLATHSSIRWAHFGASLSNTEVMAQQMFAS